MIYIPNLRLTLETSCWSVMSGCNNRHLEQLTKLFLSHKYIKIRKRLKNICTPHVTRSLVMPSFCRLELPLRTYGPIKTLQVLNEIFFKPSFIMLYTGDFTLHYYVRFLQIRSHNYVLWYVYANAYNQVWMVCSLKIF